MTVLFGQRGFFRRRRPLGMCFFAAEGGDSDAGGTDTGAADGGAGSSRSDMTGAGAGAGGDTGAADTGFSIPDAFKDKPYLKDVKTIDDVYKKLDGAQSLLGKKAVPDYKTAKDEDWEEYFSKTRPEGGKYALNEDGIFEGLRGNNEFAKGLEGVFNRAGLSQKQVDILMDPKDGYSGFVMAEIGKINGQMQAKEAEADSNFNGMAAQVFGDRKDEAIKNAVDILAEAREELGLTDDLDKMIAENPDALVNLAQRLDYIHRTYIANDTLSKKRDGGGANTNDPMALQSALDKYKSDNWSVYTDTNHARYPEIMKNVQSMSDQLMKISSLK
jgi:hypothetical protein